MKRGFCFSEVISEKSLKMPLSQQAPQQEANIRFIINYQHIRFHNFIRFHGKRVFYIKIEAIMLPYAMWVLHTVIFLNIE